MPIPSWLNPPNFLGAMQAGASTGLAIRHADEQAAARALQAEQFAAELALRRDQAAAAHEQSIRRLQAEEARYNAANALHAAQQDALTKWRMMQEQRYRDMSAEQQRSRQETLAETKRHNLATEVISKAEADRKLKQGEATIVTHPEAPGTMFLRQPNGTERPIDKPPREATEKERADLNMRAANMLEPTFTAPADSEAYKAKTNVAHRVMSAFPMASTTSTNAPSMPERIRVRSPQGKIGNIPVSQLEKALSEGYVRME